MALVKWRTLARLKVDGAGHNHHGGYYLLRAADYWTPHVASCREGEFGMLLGFRSSCYGLRQQLLQAVSCSDTLRCSSRAGYRLTVLRKGTRLVVHVGSCAEIGPGTDR